MTRSFRIRVSSRLDADRATIWAHATSMAGINEELAPIRMSAPKGARLDATVPLGQPLFRSLVTAFYVLPLDLHHLQLVSWEDGRGFHEDSTSLLEARWIHRRTLRDLDARTEVEDEVTFTPRLFGSLVAKIVRATFARRHRALRRKFGSPERDVIVDLDRA